MDWDIYKIGHVIDSATDVRPARRDASITNYWVADGDIGEELLKPQVLLQIFISSVDVKFLRPCCYQAVQK